MKADKLLGHLTLLILITLIGAGTLTPILRADQRSSTLKDLSNQASPKADTATAGKSDVVEWKMLPANTSADSLANRPAISAGENQTDVIAAQSYATDPSEIEDHLRPERLDTGPSADCRALERATGLLLEAQIRLTESRFTDKFTNKPVAGCRLAVSDIKKAGDIQQLLANLRTVLEARGWQENPTYTASGPTEEAMALQKEKAAAFLQIRWQPERQVYDILLEQTPLPQ